MENRMKKNMPKKMKDEKDADKGEKEENNKTKTKKKQEKTKREKGECRSQNMKKKTTPCMYNKKTNKQKYKEQEEQRGIPRGCSKRREPRRKWQKHRCWISCT